MNRLARLLRSHFLVGTLVLVGLGVVAGGMLVSALFRWSLVSGYHEELSVHIDELAALVAIDPQGQPFMLRRLSDPRYLPQGSGYYWQVSRDGYKTITSPSLGEARLNPGLASSDRLRMVWTEGPSGPMLEYARQVPRVGGPPLRLQIATDERLIDEAMAQFNRSLALALGIFALLLVIAVVLRVRSGLKPLARLTQDVADVRTGRAGQMVSEYSSDVTPLVNELNNLIEASKESVSRSRLVAGNLAHGLRTPLSILIDEAENLRQAGKVDAADTILREARTMQRQIDLHLARARSAAVLPFRGQSTSLGVVAERLVTAFRRLYHDRGIAFLLEPSGNVQVACDEVDLIEILSNLLDNAGKWAVSRCTLKWQADDSRVSIEIEDDGPGLAAEQREAMFQSGARLDSVTAGSGLGLAITRDLARGYGGEVRLEDAPLRGLRAIIDLPKA